MFIKHVTLNKIGPITPKNVRVRFRDNIDI